MSRKLVLIPIFLLLCSSSIFLLVRMVAADPLIYDDDFTILANGEIDPPTAPVTTLDNVTYTLTRNASLGSGIIIFRSNIIFDGANYTIDAEGAYNFGLKLDKVSNVTVSNLNSRKTEEIWLANTSDCVLVDNNFTDCHRGFYIVDSTNVTLVQNTMENTRFGEVIGDSITHYLHLIDTSNTVDGKPVYYLTSQRNLTIDPSSFPEVGCLALVNSSDITVQSLTLANIYMLFAFTNNSKIVENTIENGDYGIWAVSSSNNIISNNELVGNLFPLTLNQSSCNNTITENRIETTGGYAIELNSNSNIVSYNNISGEGGGVTLGFSSSDNVVIGNTISTSGIAVGLIQSQNNTFIKNSITNAMYVLDLEQTFNNTFYQNNFEGWTQFYTFGIRGTNVWDNGFEGNYWSDYNGTDNNQDGIGDTPYVIDENNTDHYPLMGTFQSFNVDIWAPHPHEFEEVQVISNCAIGSVDYTFWLSSDLPFIKAGDPLLLLQPVTSEFGTTGFCRIVVPNKILNISDYIIAVDGVIALVKKLPESNSTHTWLYFRFPKEVSEIIIVPEFPSFLVIPLFMVATLLAIVIYKRRILTRAL